MERTETLGLESFWFAGSQEKQLDFIRRVLESIPYPFYVIDPRTYNILLANRAGYGRGEKCYERTHKVSEPCKGDKHPCGLKEVVRTGKSLVTEHIHYDDYGNPANMELHCHPVFDELGKVVSVIEYSIDISEKIKKGEELKGLVSELKAIYNVVPLLLCLLDDQGRVIQANQAFCDFLQTSEEEMKGKRIFGDLGCINLKGCDGECGQTAWCRECSLNNLIEETLRTNQSYLNREFALSLYSHAGPRRVIFNTSTSLVKDKGKKKILVCLQDITEQKDFEQDLLNSREEAHRANRAKSEFLSRMSHELRTPMNAILGFGQLFQMDDGLDPQQKEYIKHIMKAGYHLLDLINEVLDLSRVESGKIDLFFDVIACRKLVEECAQLLNSLAQKYKVRINTRLSEDYCVKVDPLRLKQVVLNLLSNAIKYNKPEGEVTLEISKSGHHVVITVTDTGRGIPVDRQKDLFQPFSRLGAETFGIEGTGIGLTISKKLVELMGGEISFESEPGKGSTFKVHLPERVPEEDDSEEEREIPFKEAGEGTNPYKHTVLYIEDNPDNLELVRKILERRPNIRLLTAHEPVLGIELAELHKPEIIFLDLNLPQMDGYSVLKNIKNQIWGKGIPVVAVTAFAMSRDIDQGLKSGFTEYLTKPLDVIKFLSVVDKIFAGK